MTSLIVWDTDHIKRLPSRLFFFSLTLHLHSPVSPLTALCAGEAWLALNHCLVNSCRSPLMISVPPHNEVQAWMLLSDDRGGCGGCPVVVWGGAHPSPRCSIIVLEMLVEKWLWPPHKHCYRCCRWSAGLVRIEEHNPCAIVFVCCGEACRSGLVWVSSNLRPCFFSPL